LVASNSQLGDTVVFSRVHFGILDHALDLLVGQTGVCLDGDLVLYTRTLTFGVHVQDTFVVDVVGHLNLWQSIYWWWNAFQIELAQCLVTGSDFTLALEHLDGHRRLVVVSRGEHLRMTRRNRGVLLDHLGHDATQGFNTQGQRSHVQQQDVSTVARQDRTLDGCTSGNSFVRVDVFTWVTAKELFNALWHLGHTAHAADQDHVVDFRTLHASSLDGNTARLDR